MQDYMDFNIDCGRKTDRLDTMGRILRGINEHIRDNGCVLATGFPEWIEPAPEGGHENHGDPGNIVRVFAHDSRDLTRLLRVWDVAFQIEKGFVACSQICSISSRISGYQRFVRDRITEKRLARKSGANRRIFHGKTQSMPVGIPVHVEKCLYVQREFTDREVDGEFGGFGLSSPGGATIPCI